MTDRVKQARRKAERRGRSSETLAALALRLKGYRILEKRMRTPLGEIDLVVRKKDLIAFVEVKRRQDLQSAVDAVTFYAQRRITGAADLWLARRADAARLSLRFDIVAVLPRRWPVHVKDAF